MLVNSVDPDGDFSKGAVNRAIFEEAGHDIRQEYSRINPDGIRVGHVSVTSAGNLGCKKICHGLLNQGWDQIGHISLKVSVLLRCHILKC